MQNHKRETRFHNYILLFVNKITENLLKRTVEYATIGVSSKNMNVLVIKTFVHFGDCLYEAKA